MGHSTDARERRRSVALDPANAKLHYLVGQVDCYSMDPAEVREGMEQIRRATELNPMQPEYWSGLASACGSTGDAICADQAMKHTLALAPTTPRYRWIAANYDLAQNRSREALKEFQQLLKMDPTYAPETFRLCLRIVNDPERIYQGILADRKDPHLNFAFINYLLAHDQGAQAYPVWQDTLALNESFPFAMARPYLDWLVRQGPNQDAVNAWLALQAHGIIKRSPSDSADNMVFNSGFEQPLLNAGFGWRVKMEPYTRVSLDDSVTFEGQKSLRVDFTVSRNTNDEPLYQISPVSPDHCYRLQAYVSSDSISSDSGPRLRVRDPNCVSCLNVMTVGTVGTTSWHMVDMDFCTGPETRQVEISIWRPRSLGFPDEITGRFWLDAISLREDKSREQGRLDSSKPRS